MKKFVLGAVFAFLMISPALAAESKLLNIDLAQDKVSITTGFTGSSLTVFGVKQGRGDVVIVLEGPIKQSTVRKKDRVMGAWVNTQWIDFQTVPSYYDYAISGENPENFMTLKNRQKEHIGIDALWLKPDESESDAQTLQKFQDALVRIKQSRHLFSLKPQKITYIDDRFFRVDFPLPSNVPRGEYTVRGMLIRDGLAAAEVTRTMKVAQIGFSSNVNKVAQNHGFLYGLLCVFIAFFAGLLSDLLIRRN
jgi:uncharacterized protein (TIGR02186 family)